MIGLLTKKKIKQMLIYLTKQDYKGVTNTRSDDFYYACGVANAVTYICHELGYKYEDIARAARPELFGGNNHE